MINKYDLAIETIDFQIGRLYKYLKKKNLWKDTIFVILGDHGTNLTDHNVYFSSSSLYDNTIHVPMIMHLPGIKSGEINEFAQNVDILPTIMDSIGYKIDEKIDGLSLMSLIEKGEPIRDKVFSWDGLSENIKSVRTKKRKLILAEDASCNLCKSSHHEKKEEYDLEKDLMEKKNIYSESEDNQGNELWKSLEEKKKVPVKSDYF
jgi:arylsulfatase A-like enzyme